MDWGVSVVRSVADAALPEWVLAELGKGEFYATESVGLDFKRDHYGEDAESIANAARDIGALYNAFGGFIVIGVEEIERDVKYRVVGAASTSFNAQLIKGNLANWFGSDIPFTVRQVELVNGQFVCVIWVPKRAQNERPKGFVRRGPQIKPGKYVFDAGDVPVRRADSTVLARTLEDWHLVLGARSLDALAASIGQIVPDRRSGAALEHNLPSRSVICSQFVGRQKVLTEVWAWLNDQFQYAKVIAGEGGKGKTSVAYEFATQVAHVAPRGIERIVWLTAKKRQFSGIENTWRALPETHFGCFRTMLEALGQRLGYTDEEMRSASDAEIKALVRSEIAIQPTLFVLDDLDSLSVDDQRRALEFAQQAGSESIRFLLTTRSNASYSSEAAITLGGLELDEYSEFVAILSERYGIADLGRQSNEKLHKATNGSPLLTDSILRVIRRGSSLSKAIDEWRGQSGEDARNAVLGREIDQLSREAKRALLSLSFLGQCSKSELMNVSGILAYKLEDVLEELQSLFIVSAPKIIESEPRFEIGAMAALLVIAKRAELAGDHVALERRVREMRSGAKASAGTVQNVRVASVISQALAMLSAKNVSDALKTVDAGLKSERQHADLLLFKARILALESDPPDYVKAKDLLIQAHSKGARKHILFDLLYKCERELSDGNGVISVSENAIKEFPNEEAVWVYRKAEGYVLNALFRTRNREFDQALTELSAAARELHHAQKRASASEQGRIQGFLVGVHNQILEQLANASSEVKVSEVSVIRELLERGDQRSVVVQAMAGAVHRRMVEYARKLGPSSTRDHIEANRLYVLDILRSKGQDWTRVLQAQLADAAWTALFPPLAAEAKN